MQVRKLNVRKIPFLKNGFLNFLYRFKIHQLAVLQIKFYKPFEVSRYKLRLGVNATVHSDICRKNTSEIFIGW